MDIHIRNNDDYIGLTCPFCQSVLKPGQDVVKCAQCGTYHHKECWLEYGACSMCSEKRKPEKVSNVINKPEHEELIEIACPACNCWIFPGQSFVKCAHCGTYHHKECWNEEGACSMCKNRYLSSSPFYNIFAFVSSVFRKIKNNEESWKYYLIYGLAGLYIVSWFTPPPADCIGFIFRLVIYLILCFRFVYSDMECSQRNSHPTIKLDTIAGFILVFVLFIALDLVILSFLIKP